jgi:squalene-associated FAD-dependent desaturase
LSAPDAIVVGGGIAGVAAGLRLADAGLRVTLLETRRKLGGRATSFDDARSGLEIDNCQHVALGCCTNYLDLCDRLGVGDHIDWQDTIHWYEAGGRRSELRAGLMPAPAHGLGSLLSAAFLSAPDKLALARAMSSALQADRARFADRPFADWLTAHGQGERLIRRFWTPLIVSACNLPADRVSAAVMLHVLQEGMLASARAGEMGVPAVPLARLYDPAERLLAASGGELRLGVGVARVTATEVTTTAGETLTADHVVCAVPAERAARLVDPDLRRADPRFAALDRVEHSPILGVHLVLDRPVLPTPNAVLVDRPTHWLFRKDEAGARLHAVISAADAWMDLDEPARVERVMHDVRACLTGAADAEVVSARAVMEKRATFASTPEFEAERPPAAGPSGLILAGDYTATGWPSTMEGATRSGYLAAAAVLGLDPADLLTPALRPAPLVRWFGGRTVRRQHLARAGA